MEIEYKQVTSYPHKFVVCFSGGHSSALCAINAVLLHGKENVILLNHDINPQRESADIKRFKNEVADYLGLPITYANHKDWETATPVSVCIDAKAWKAGNSQILCTNRLKTEPFHKWLKENDPERVYTYLYGYDTSKKELARIARRVGVMGEMGYKTDYPLATWKGLKVTNTEDIGIARPNSYENFVHANCLGCLKAGWQHWYIIFVHRQDIWQEAKAGEDKIGYAIHYEGGEPVYLTDREELFADMLAAGIPTTEHIPNKKFWATVNRVIKKSHLQLQINQAILFDESMACQSCAA